MLLLLTLFRTPGGWSLLPALQSLASTPVAGWKAACGVVLLLRGFTSLPTYGIATGYMVSDIAPSASHASGRVARIPLLAHLAKKG
jgi:hypothetical protein